MLRGIIDDPPEDYVDERGGPPGEGAARDPGEVIPFYDEEHGAEEQEHVVEGGVGHIPLEPQHDSELHQYHREKRNSEPYYPIRRTNEVNESAAHGGMEKERRHLLQSEPT